MSFPTDCPACVQGNHDKHDPGHGTIPGLIGGTRCDCTGDCRQRARDRTNAFVAAMFGPPVDREADR